MKIVLTLILIFTLNIVFGQTANTYPIDIELKTCLDSCVNYTTKGMTDCFIQSTEKWESELNLNYQKLQKLLTNVQKEKLINAQKQWLVYRDKELEFSNQLYLGMQGTMWIPVAVESKLELTKQRSLEFSNYISNLTIDNSQK